MHMHHISLDLSLFSGSAVMMLLPSNSRDFKKSFELDKHVIVIYKMEFQFISFMSSKAKSAKNSLFKRVDI